jgi:hypothetical protein
MAVRDRTEDHNRPYDSPDGFYVTAGYPWRGRYEILQSLYSKEFVRDGKGGVKLVITHFPLCHYLIDMILPMILAFQALSVEEQQAARAFAEAEESRVETERIADRMLAEMPIMNPVSYSGQGCHTALIDKKMEQIQRVWDRMSKSGSRPVFSRGLAQGQRPEPIGFKN